MLLFDGGLEKIFEWKSVWAMFSKHFLKKIFLGAKAELA